MATKTVSSQRTTTRTAKQAGSNRTVKLTNAQREEVARVAYQLWIDSGHQHGRDREHWLQAEAIVISRLS